MAVHSLDTPVELQASSSFTVRPFVSRGWAELGVAPAGVRAASPPRGLAL